MGEMIAIAAVVAFGVSFATWCFMDAKLKSSQQVLSNMRMTVERLSDRNQRLDQHLKTMEITHIPVGYANGYLAFLLTKQGGSAEITDDELESFDGQTVMYYHDSTAAKTLLRLTIPSHSMH